MGELVKISALSVFLFLDTSLFLVTSGIGKMSSGVTSRRASPSDSFGRGSSRASGAPCCSISGWASGAPCCIGMSVTADSASSSSLNMLEFVWADATLGKP